MPEAVEKKSERLVVGSEPSFVERLLAPERKRPAIGPVAESALIGHLNAFLPQLQAANRSVCEEASEEPSGDRIDPDEGTICAGDVGGDTKHVEINVFVDDSLGELVSATDAGDEEVKSSKRPRIEVLHRADREDPEVLETGEPASSEADSEEEESEA